MVFCQPMNEKYAQVKLVKSFPQENRGKKKQKNFETT